MTEYEQALDAIKTLGESDPDCEEFCLMTAHEKELDDGKTIIEFGIMSNGSLLYEFGRNLANTINLNPDMMQPFIEGMAAAHRAGLAGSPSLRIVADKVTKKE